MVISHLDFNSDKTSIEVIISSSIEVTKVSLLDKTNFDEAEGYVFTEKYIDDELFNITLSDLNIGKFSGVYVLEVYLDNGQVFRKALIEFTDFKKCILDKVLEKGACNFCLQYDSRAIINSFNILQALELARDVGSTNSLFTLANSLDLYCSAECSECGK